jgi:hypothetical protein
LAKTALHESTIKPFNEIKKRLDEQKSLKKVSLNRKELDGIEDNEMNLGNVRDTKEGRIVNVDMINLLKEKQRLKKIEVEKAAKNINDKIIADSDKNREAVRLLTEAVNYFKSHPTEDARKTYINIKSQIDVHRLLKSSFKRKVTDPNGNGKTLIKLPILKNLLYDLILERLNNMDVDDDNEANEANDDIDNDNDDDDDNDNDNDNDNIDNNINNKRKNPETNDDDEDW